MTHRDSTGQPVTTESATEPLKLQSPGARPMRESRRYVFR